MIKGIIQTLKGLMITNCIILFIVMINGTMNQSMPIYILFWILGSFLFLFLIWLIENKFAYEVDDE